MKRGVLFIMGVYSMVLLFILIVLNIANMIFAMRIFVESKRREGEIQEKIIDLRNELIRFAQNKK